MSMNRLQHIENGRISDADSRAFDIVRLTANYMIVLMHSWAASQYCAEGSIEFNIWNFICNSFSAAAMPSLFLMSGYLLMSNFSPQMASGKLKRRVKRLLVPLFAWNLFFVVFYLMVARFVPRISARVDSFNLNTFGGILNKIIGLVDRPLDAPLWYLKTVFIYSLFAIPIWWLLRKKKAYLLYLLAVVSLVLSVCTPLGHPMKYSFPAYSIFAFIIGCHLGHSGASVFRLFENKIWLICPLFGSTIVFKWLVSSGGNYAIWRDVGFLLMLPLLFTMGSWLVKICANCRFYPFALKSSFFVYAGHFFFCSIMLHTFAPKILGAFGNGFGVLTGLIIFFCTMGLSVTLLAYKIGKMSMGRWFGIWDGSL